MLTHETGQGWQLRRKGPKVVGGMRQRRLLGSGAEVWLPEARGCPGRRVWLHRSPCLGQRVSLRLRSLTNESVWSLSKVTVKQHPLQ